MDLESSTCPSCGAPVSLPVGATVGICHYCNCALRVPPSTALPAEAPSGSSTLSSGPPLVVADASVSTETITRIKRLLLRGQRDDAVALYEAEARCDRKTAAATVDGYTLDAVWSTEAKVARLTAVGMVLTVGALVLFASGIDLSVTRRVAWTSGAWMVVSALTLLLFLRRAFLRTLRYLFATAGMATVVRFGRIGESGDKVVFRVLLDVREPSGSTFRAETSALVKDVDASAMKEGHRIRVKYFRGATASVLYDGELGA